MASASRPIGMRVRRFSRTPRLSNVASMSVLMIPGCTELTLMPWAANSLAADFVMPRTANFDALYAPNIAAPLNPAIDEMLMIDPLVWCWTICRATDCIPSHTPTRLMSMMRRKSDSGAVSSGVGLKMPALLTKMSMRPCSVTVCLATSSHSSALVTSRCW